MLLATEAMLAQRLAKKTGRLAGAAKRHPEPPRLCGAQHLTSLQGSVYMRTITLLGWQRSRCRSSTKFWTCSEAEGACQPCISQYCCVMNSRGRCGTSGCLHFTLIALAVLTGAAAVAERDKLLAGACIVTRAPLGTALRWTAWDRC